MILKGSVDMLCFIDDVCTLIRHGAHNNTYPGRVIIISNYKKHHQAYWGRN